MSPYVPPLRENVAIAFSSKLATASVVKKQDALDDLIKVIENHTTIEDESVEAFQLIEDIWKLFVAYGQQQNNVKDKTLPIPYTHLTPYAMQEIESLGFHVLR